jgi:hypothetical protein
MNFLDFYSSLMGFIPELGPENAKRIVNRSWKDIRMFRPWSFLLVDTVITIPAVVNTGTALVTQYTNTVTMDVTASAAITGLNNPILTLRQFRRPVGPVYNIVSADFTAPAAVVLTLDRNYQEATDPTATYQIYQVYYPAPSSDFLRWVSVFNPINSYKLKLHMTRQEIDRRDPQRASQGLSYWIVQYKMNTLSGDPNVPFFELWPHMISQVGLQAFYQKRGTDLVDNTDTIPPQVRDDTLLTMAKYYACEWGEANKGRHQSLKESDWLALRRQLRVDWKETLFNDAVKDENTVLQLLLESQDARGTMGPIDSNWMQTHASPWG